MTVEQYLRHAPQLWPVTSFAVPSRLAAGYGQYQVQGSGTTASYLYAIVWVSHNRLFNIGIEYSAPQKSPAQVISVAVAQSQASPLTEGYAAQSPGEVLANTLNPRHPARRAAMAPRTRQISPSGRRADRANRSPAYRRDPCGNDRKPIAAFDDTDRQG